MVMKLRILLLILGFSISSTFGSILQFDPASSAIHVHVPKTGLLSFAGHEHTIVATEFSASLFQRDRDLAPESISLEIKSGALLVTDEKLEEADRAKVRKNMLSGEVLSASEHPFIKLESSQINVMADDKWIIVGQLSIRGVSTKIKFPVAITTFSDGRLRAAGSVELTLADFGIAPVSAMGGMVSTGKSVTVRFELTSINPTPQLRDDIPTP